MRHIKVITEHVQLGSDVEHTFSMPDDTVILASTDKGGHVKVVLGVPICGEETNKGTPCRRVVDKHGDKCHDHE